jgi:hypothetical protein
MKTQNLGTPQLSGLDVGNSIASMLIQVQQHSVQWP